MYVVTRQKIISVSKAAQHIANFFETIKIFDWGYVEVDWLPPDTALPCGINIAQRWWVEIQVILWLKIEWIDKVLQTTKYKVHHDKQQSTSKSGCEQSTSKLGCACQQG